MFFSSFLEKYGFKKEIEDKFCIKNGNDELLLNRTVLKRTGDNDIVIIAQSPQSRIHGFLKSYDKNKDSLDQLFRYSSDRDEFAGIFLVFDLDHNDVDDCSRMIDLFSDEASGLLLLSSPCVEVLIDLECSTRTNERYERLGKYKAKVNSLLEKIEKKKASDYLKERFEERAIYFLDKNVSDFGSMNVMEHPRMIVEKSNLLNICHNGKSDDEKYVIINLFTTVLYVFVAYIMGATREIENYETVRKLFSDMIGK